MEIVILLFRIYIVGDSDLKSWDQNGNENPFLSLAKTKDFSWSLGFSVFPFILLFIHL